MGKLFRIEISKERYIDYPVMSNELAYAARDGKGFYYIEEIGKVTEIDMGEVKNKIKAIDELALAVESGFDEAIQDLKTLLGLEK